MRHLCPKCSKAVEEFHEYCSKCGLKQDFSFHCPKCNNPRLYSQSYCVKCGSKLDTAAIDAEQNSKWRLFPVSIILYLTILAVHLVFLLIFRQRMINNMAFVGIFDAVMIIIWSTFPAYKIKEILKFKFKLKPIHIILYVGGVVLFFAFALGLVKLLQLWLELPKTSMTKSLMERGGYSFAAVILMVCVQPALIEELAFRGIVYKALDNALKPRETILISAFLFAMLHLSLVSMFHLMLLGLFFGYIRYKTKSIWPSVLAHFLHNFGAVIVDKYNLF